MAKEITSKKIAVESEGVFTKMWRYLAEVGVELKKTTWPSRAELARSTMVVIAAVVIVSLWISVCEQIMVRLTRDLLHMY